MNSLGNSLSKQHRYNTRDKMLPNLPKHTSKMYNDSFLLQSLKNYNSLESTIKNCQTIDSFTSKIKDAAIMSYNV